MTLPDIGDVVRVHPGVVDHGRRLSGLHLTVTTLDAHDPCDVELDATEYTGDRPIHLHLSDVDVVTHHAGRAAA